MRSRLLTPDVRRCPRLWGVYLTSPERSHNRPVRPRSAHLPVETRCVDRPVGGAPVTDDPEATGIEVDAKPSDRRFARPAGPRSW